MGSITDFSHKLLKESLNSNDVCLDLTLGNGNDAIFLSNICKFVYGFDIQEIAIENSQKQFIQEGRNNYKLIKDSHENFDMYIEGNFSGVIFNLGYLPGADKEITTNANTVLVTLKKVIKLINNKGIVIIVFYPGHESGKEEVEILGEYLKNLDQNKFDVIKYEFYNYKNNSPFIIKVVKL